MFRENLTVDFNGLVLMDPTELLRLTGPVRSGENILGRFSTTSLGDDAIRGGAVVPILSIDDSSYDVVVRYADEPALGPAHTTNGVFPLHVVSRCVVADLVVLWQWSGEMGWYDVDVPPGFYAVTMNGVREPQGYEFVLTPVAELPEVTGDLNVRMSLWD